MCPFLVVTFLALCVAAWAENYTVDVNMAGIKGNLKFDSIHQMAVINLTGLCEQTVFSVHEYPVMYGHFPDPCHQENIGDQLSQFIVNDTSQPVNVEELFQRNNSLTDFSILVQSCGLEACATVRTKANTTQTWHAKFYTSLAGEVHFRQHNGEGPLTVLTDLIALDEEHNTELTVTMHLLSRCDNILNEHSPTDFIPIKVGTPQKKVKSHLELPGTKIQAFVHLNYKDQWLCAEVRELLPIDATAVINMKGTKGSFHFRQISPFDPTQLVVKLENLSNNISYFHVHQYPVRLRKFAKENLCSESNTGGHWNPFSINISASTYPKALAGTHDQYELGDLSGRYGSLQGLKNFQSTYIDWNLPLFGRNSIIGRSIVIHKSDNSRILCGNIENEGEMTTAVAVFRKTLVGRIVFRQLKNNPYADLSIFIELSYSNSSVPTTTNHNWHVHEFPISTEMDSSTKACASTHGHFNPSSVSNINYNLECHPFSPFRCEVGDFSGKLMPIQLPNHTRLGQAKSFFTDTTSALSGFASIVGRSVVIHGAERVVDRIGCANVTILHPVTGKTEQWFGPGQAKGEFQVSQNLDLDSTLIKVNFTELNGLSGGYHVHILPIKQNSLEACADNYIKGHFNPFHVNMTSSPAPGNGTADQYEVGDISGKYGMLTNENFLSEDYIDPGLPLSGPYSILGRSLVIHYVNGSRMQCSNILPQSTEDGEWLRAEAVFTGRIKGKVLLAQQIFPDGSASDVTIEVDLKAADMAFLDVSELQWYIQENSLLCTEDGEPYNPYEIFRDPGYESSCSPVYPLHCAVGDMLGKHGPATLGQRQLFTDSNLPLTGDFTVAGRVLMLQNGSEVVGCTLIRPDVPITELIYHQLHTSSRYELRNAISQALQIPIWKITLLPKAPVKSLHSSCKKRNFFVIGYNDTKKLESIKDKLGKFSSSALCSDGTALTVTPSKLFCLWILLVFFMLS
ncbi:uncharacterized protein LOC115466359 [Microcaecilia unicolor]|uniref:Uncharacterized protein LOC115466359 n=1 Tax=Microcaecilia unicolor TaxID=1415580 RepID=A0A6P7XLM4_9AMPH|nr:uncharacterized protein LOC115466359 [Microcaecilia unicolor]